MKLNIVNTARQWLTVAGVATAATAASFGLVSAFSGQGENGAATTPAADSVRIDAGIPVGQQAALADGVVTLQEYEAAVQRTLACATAAGVKVEPTPGAGLRPTSFGFASASREELAASHKRVDACREAHLNGIEMALAHQPVAADVIDQSRQLLAQCVSSRLAVGSFDANSVVRAVEGSLASPSRSGADWDMLRAWDTCRSSVEEATGFRP
jgi:hypothetical protein